MGRREHRCSRAFQLSAFLIDPVVEWPVKCSLDGLTSHGLKNRNFHICCAEKNLENVCKKYLHRLPRIDMCAKKKTTENPIFMLSQQPVGTFFSLSVGSYVRVSEHMVGAMHQS